MSTPFFIITALIALLMTHTDASAQRPSYGPDISITEAKKIAAAAIAEAERNNWRLAIAVVDTHGQLVYFERMDDTQTASVAIALDKARTAAMFRRPSRAFEEAVAGGRIAVMALQGATPVIGGLPILVDGKIVGGIGASGEASADDEQAVKAGLEGLQ